ncbi:hypothetical protein Mbov_0855 [Mycoplasmopsis bovis HB0801]|nr:hypothetical protein Mbov_0855 [Mycoplasmopsis bovis HB0801]
MLKLLKVIESTNYSVCILKLNAGHLFSYFVKILDN